MPRGSSNSRWRRWVAALGLLVVAVLWLGTRAGSFLVVERPIESPDAIISLASHEWERLPETIRLAHRYPDSLVLLTLPPVVDEYNCHDCAHRVDLLRRNGISGQRIRVLPITLSGTFGEAAVAFDFVTHEHIRRLIVVTSPYHTRRSLATFRRVFDESGVDIGIEPATATSPARPYAWWRTPYDRWYVRYEWAAMGYYLVRHHVNAFWLKP
jgi:uncharacterized SAM-binding protein YcdF (DUF218 family)